MAAVYPGAVKSFGSPVADAVDTVYAAHVNDLRDEVVAVETELGTGLKSSTWTGAWANTASWSNLAARLTNIERGIVTTSDVHTQYLKKAGDAMTGALDMGSQKITGLQAGTSTNDVVNYGQVILRSGVNAMSADLNMGTSYKITNLANGTNAADAVNKSQLDAVSTTANAALARSGGTMTGAIAMGSNKVTGLAAATTNGDAVRYEQLVATDASVAALGTFSSWTPTITQGSSVAKTSVSYYTQIGKLVIAYAFLGITGSGTPGSVITLTLPAAPAAAGRGGGSWWHYDPGNTNYTGFADIAASSIRLFRDVNGQQHGVNAGTLSSGDTVTVVVTYEAA